MKLDTEQMVTQTEIAAMKGMKLPLLAYYLAKPGSPQPVTCKGKRLYLRSQVVEWQPKRNNKGRKSR